MVPDGGLHLEIKGEGREEEEGIKEGRKRRGGRKEWREKSARKFSPL